MKSPRNAKGSAHIIIIIVLVVALLAALSWIFWKNFIAKQPKTETTSSVVKQETKKSTPAPKVANGYMEVQDWGVQIKKPADGTVIQFGEFSDGTSPSANTLGVSTAAVTALDPTNCTTANGALGVLQREKTKNTAMASAPIALNNEQPIDGYYYYFVEPQAACMGTTPTGEQAQTIQNDTTAVHDSVMTLMPIR